MIRRTLTLPELGLIAGTRAMLGAGLGLLLADRLAPESRRAVGWTLVGVGVITTFPLVAQVLLGPGPATEGSGEKTAKAPERELATAGPEI